MQNIALEIEHVFVKSLGAKIQNFAHQLIFSSSTIRREILAHLLTRFKMLSLERQF